MLVKAEPGTTEGIGVPQDPEQHPTWGAAPVPPWESWLCPPSAMHRADGAGQESTAVPWHCKGMLAAGHRATGHRRHPPEE